MAKITVEKIMGYESCDDYSEHYSEHRLRGIIGDGKTIAEYCDLSTSLFDSPADKFWILLECDILSNKLLHKIAIRAVESVLPIFESQHPGDDRLRNAIETKKLWMIGWATDIDLEDARSAVVHIAGAVGEAARSATRAAELTFVTSVAWAAIAAGAARGDIYEDLFKLIKEGERK